MAFISLIARCLSLSLLIACAHAVVLPANNPASQYMGTKVVRVPTGPSTDVLQKLKSVISDLQLELWTGTPRVNSHVDVEVPPLAYDAFTRATNQLLKDAGILEPVTMMHEDLGKSILEESNIPDEYHQEVGRVGKFFVLKPSALV
jgi:hypothetical protein